MLVFKLLVYYDGLGQTSVSQDSGRSRADDDLQSPHLDLMMSDGIIQLLIQI